MLFTHIYSKTDYLLISLFKESVFMPPIFIGLSLSLLGIGFGVGTGIIVKFLANDVNLLVTLFYRFLFSLPVLFLVAIMTRGRDFYKINAKKTLLVRVAFGMAGIVFWFLSVRHLPLGLATSIMHSSVIYVAMLSPFLLGEKVGIYRWSAALTGLLGVFVISGALSPAFEAAIFLAVFASLAGGGLQLALRRLGKSDAPASVASWYNFMGFVAVSLVFLVLPSYWQIPEAGAFPYLILLGLFGSGLQICFTASFRYVDAVVIATIRYLQVPLAGLVGYFAFQEVPTTTHYIGAVLIIGSCLVIVFREFQNRSKMPIT